MVLVNDANTGQLLALNRSTIVAVFTAQDGEMEGKTIVAMTQGNWVVSQTQQEVIDLVEADASAA